MLNVDVAVYSFLMRVSGDGGADLFSLVSGDRTRGNGLKLYQGMFRLVIREKFFTCGSGQALEQAPQGSGHGPKPVGVQETFGQCSSIYGLTCPVWSQELDSVMTVGPFQLRTFYDSTC